MIFRININALLCKKKYGARIENAVNADLGEFPWIARVGRIEESVNM